jgi:septal ring factor EnvC (AmiA/AmiB activator)
MSTVYLSLICQIKVLLMTANTPTNQNEEYAQQWISFLRKRNTILNIVWPLLLVFSIAGLLVSFYFYQLSTSFDLERQLTESKLSENETELGLLTSSFNVLQEKNDTLQSKLQSLVNDKEQLSDEKNDTDSQISVHTQMNDALKSQVEIMRSEKIAMKESIDEAKVLLLQQQEDSSQLSLVNEGLLKENELLNEQVESRKYAYLALAKRQKEFQSEIDRLDQALLKKESAEASLRKQKSNLDGLLNDARKNSQTLKAKYQSRETKYGELEEKLQVMMSPLGSKKQSSTLNKKSDSQGSSSQGMSAQGLSSRVLSPPSSNSGDEKAEAPKSSRSPNNGLQELKSPEPGVAPIPAAKPTKEVKAKSSKSAAFDYDQISVQ